MRIPVLQDVPTAAAQNTGPTLHAPAAPRRSNGLDVIRADANAAGESDSALLRAFVDRRDADAFRRLVERYTPLVYAAARRQLRGGAPGATSGAEDVTQAVFILLARKAKSIGGGERLAGWLVNATRLAAKASLRMEARRKRRERHAAEMSPTRDSDMRQARSGVEEIVDDALCRLGEADRTAVTLRYLQGMSQREVAAAMGVSEDAAAQRLSRALAKLRKFFAGRSGGALAIATPAMVGEQLLQPLTHSAVPVPPGLAELSTAAALHSAGITTGAVAGAHVATAIARMVLVSMNWRTLGTIAAAVALVLMLTLGGAATYTTVHRTSGMPPYARPAGPLGPVKVGVFISATTALNKPPEDGAWYNEFRVMEEIQGTPELDLTPIIEPGSENAPQQKRLLRYYFRDKPPILVSDADALRRQDVIVAGAVHETSEDALKSIAAAVSGGAGLYIRGCLGGCKPGPASPTATSLRGYSGEWTSGNFPDGADCVVLAGHPLLGDLSGHVGESLHLEAGGGMGRLRPGPGGVPLIRVKSMAGYRIADWEPKIETSTLPGDLLYTTSLGKGRIVVLSSGGPTPPALQRATGSRFVIRVCRWLAGREIE